ncbi:MAG: putative type secretion system protein IcmK/DotH [Gammaproteobacteria bacterium]|nr:putative type secretion system protein IcmK/DotH [Gammaproteobacteria bacterium]
MKPSHIIWVCLVVVCTATGRAQTAPPTNPPAAPAQPDSGLGKQVGSPSSEARAAPREVVEQAIEDIESSQLTDAEFSRIKQLYLRRERQKATPYVVPGKPVVRTLTVRLDPGTPPPMLRLTRGLPTSVVFSDLTGQPWFIKEVALNRDMFSDGHEGASQGDQSEPTNVLSVEPKTAASYGSVSIRLKGLPTPVIFVLAAAQQEVDLRVDAEVPGRNPDALDTTTYATLPSIDESLVGFLDGVPPKDARPLHVSGFPNTEAWFYQDSTYVRTDAQPQYPAYYSSVRSTSGRAVYRFNARESSVTLLSAGRAVTVFMEE